MLDLRGKKRRNAMKKPMIFGTLLILIALLTSACEINVTTGSGKVITQNKAVSGFSSVTFAGVGELNITQGSTESLTIEGEDNVLARIRTEVKDGNLYIGFERENWQDMIRPTRAIKYDLKLKNLNNLDLSGAGSVNIPRLQAENLVFRVSGAGGVKINQLTATNVTCTLSGAGNVEMNGKVTNQSITLSGLGNYSVGDLQSVSATIGLTGAGSATLWARDLLNVKISGAGSVSYYGSPKVNKEITGLGVLNSLGSK
jgi:predicted small secreted protein